MKKTRNGLLDIIKFAAAIGIMLGHWHSVWPQEIDGLKITGTLFKGCDARLAAFVALFFTVSGYYAAKSFDALSEGSLPTGAYIKRRIRRLFPPAILSIVFSAAVQLLYRMDTGQWWLNRKVNLSGFILSVTGSYNWGYKGRGAINSPFWFVSILFLCLLIYAAVAGSKMSRTAKIAFITAIAVLGLASMQMEWSFPLLANKPSRAYLSFFSGILFGLSFKQEEKKKFPVLWLAILAAAAALALINTRTSLDLIGDRVIIYSLLIAPALIRIGESDPLQFLATGLSRELGGVSFCVYLIHVPVYTLTALIAGSRMDYTSYASFGLVLIIVVLFTWILYRLSPKLETAFIWCVRRLGF